MKTLKVKGMWNDLDAEFTVKGVDAGVQADIQDEATETRVIGSSQQTKALTGKMRILTVLKCLVDAPFTPINESNVRLLDRATFEALYDAISDLSGVKTASQDFTKLGERS